MYKHFWHRSTILLKVELCTLVKNRKCEHRQHRANANSIEKVQYWIGFMFISVYLYTRRERENKKRTHSHTMNKKVYARLLPMCVVWAASFRCQKTSVKIVNFSTKIEKVSVAIFRIYTFLCMCFECARVCPCSIATSLSHFWSSVIIYFSIFFSHFSLQLWLLSTFADFSTLILHGINARIMLFYGVSAVSVKDWTAWGGKRTVEEMYHRHK